MSSIKQVTVRAPARLHMGFLDLHGGLGRCFGSLGLSLSEPQICLQARHSDQLRITGPGAARATEIVQSLQRRYACAGVNLHIQETYPEHVGLGFGTQLSLAVGTAVLRLHGYSLPLEELAVLLGRGRRSGIGVGAFASGGLLLDGGSGSASRIPPILCRLPFPQDWTLLLILDERRRGLSGEEEKRRFHALEPMSEAITASLCRLMLMRLLPALQERRCQEFGAALTELQQHLGEYFSPVQENVFNSPEVAEAMIWLYRQGAAGYGQSSWGPVGFVLYASRTSAAQARDQARSGWPDLDFRLAGACNHGAQIDCQDDSLRVSAKCSPC